MGLAHGIQSALKLKSVTGDYRQAILFYSTAMTHSHAIPANNASHLHL